jgi:hypothetical protein
MNSVQRYIIVFLAFGVYTLIFKIYLLKIILVLLIISIYKIMCCVLRSANVSS